jgi:hypothetical protein
VFSADIGMNRQNFQLLQKWFRVPHACGDEGVSVFSALPGGLKPPSGAIKFNVKGIPS